MTEEIDFLKAAVAAMEDSEHALIIASYDDMIEGADYQMRRAQALALLSLAQDVRRVADALEGVIEHDPEKVICPAVRTWGGTSS